MEFTYLYVQKFTTRVKARGDGVEVMKKNELLI
jgi:hypothetical protein